MQKLFATALLALSLGACATTAGNDQINDFARFQELKPAETTKLQVRELFGQPYDVQYAADQSSQWIYYMAVMRTNAATMIPFVGLVAGGSDVDGRIATFWFDPSGAYLRNESRTKSTYMNMWAGLSYVANSNVEADRAKAEMEKLGQPFDKKKADWMKGIADIFGEGVDGAPPAQPAPAP